MANRDNHVAEMPGLYGPFTITERVVQKIWLRGDFSRTDLALTDDRALGIQSPGKWNLLGGPDFKDAQLTLAGRTVSGDIEVHFHARDWHAHGHAADPAYANVVLHVVLFPLPAGERPARHRDGREIPTLVLLPYLHRGLEEYGSDDALETLTERDEWQHYAELAGESPPILRRRLRGLAAKRWRQKVHFAKQRLDRLGWEEALHHAALEILGYRQNRAAMLSVAARYPLSAWRPEIASTVIWCDPELRWQGQGVRPANHPRQRLLQYQRWMQAVPDWPHWLQELGAGWPAVGTADLPTKEARRRWALSEHRQALATAVVGDAVGGTRFDNLVCDGFLPLLAARLGEEAIWPWWFHWPLGDVPAAIRRVLGKLEVTDRREHPHCHGWGQGMLGWFLTRRL